MIQQKLFGNIGLNLDDDQRYFGEDDSNLIQNMLPDMDGEGGLLETLPGNKKVLHAGINFAGQPKVIGACKDPRTNYVYYFVKDFAFGLNSIIQFDPIAETYRKIVFEESLLLMGDHVYGAVVFGDYVIYNTLSHGVYKVHIDYGNRYYNTPLWSNIAWELDDIVRDTDGNCYVAKGDHTNNVTPASDPTNWEFEYYTYPTISATTFVLRNMPPVDRPSVAYGTDSSRLVNNLLKKTFQFAYRYKYVDAGYSTYSPYSDICLPQNVETWDGSLVDSMYYNNKIVIGFARGPVPQIEYVELIVRESNNGDWLYFAKVSDNVSTIDFFNDEQYEAVEQDEVLKIEDAVPRSCADSTLISDNRLVLLRPTEGFDNIDIDVALWPIKETVTVVGPTPATIGAELFITPIVTGTYSGGSLDTSSIEMGDGYAVGVVMLLAGTVLGRAFMVEHILEGADVASKDALIDRIMTYLYSAMFPEIAEIWQISAGVPASEWNITDDDIDDVELVLHSPTGYVHGSVSFLDPTIAVDLNKWNTYKTGSIHPHGIEYFDSEFRRSTVQYNPQCDAKVMEKWNYSGTHDFRIKMGWRIAHTAPAWARYWRWTYAGNKTQSYFVQYVISDTNRTMAAPYSNYVGLDITPLQALKTDGAPNTPMPDSIIDPYVFHEGDRVKILTAPAVAGAYGAALYAGTFYDLPILGINENMIFVQKPAAGTYGAGVGSLIEIYTPRTFIEDAELYFPVGPMNLVSDGMHLNSDIVNGTSQRIGFTITGTANGGLLRTRITTSIAHDLSVGDWVRVSDTIDHNGDWAVLNVSDGTHFDIGEAYVAPSQAGSVIVMASGVLEHGDSYVIARAFSLTLSGGTASSLFPVESMHWSDFYLSDSYDRGKPNIFSSLGETTQNSVRWGLKHLPGVPISNLFTFDALDYKDTTSIYGNAVRFGECGDVLKLLFFRKVAGMYIGKSEYIDTEGSSVVAVSDNVLSNPNYYADDYGTHIPEAVLFVKGYVYFIDLLNGAVIRSTSNGSYPISGMTDAVDGGNDYKMQSFFRSLCHAAQEALPADTRFLMGWDNGRKLLYVTIIVHGLPTPELRTFVFRESRSRWVAALELSNQVTSSYPTCYEWSSDKFFSWCDGGTEVWNHSDPSATALSIYGEAKVATVSVWGVVQPQDIKVFDSIVLHTDNAAWSGVINIPESLSYPDGMESRLLTPNFVRREGKLYADYMFNGRTDGGTLSALNLYNGEPLRGYVIENVLSISSKAKLFKVDVNWRNSTV